MSRPRLRVATILLRLVCLPVYLTVCLLGCDGEEGPPVPEDAAEPIIVQPDGSGTYATIQAAINAAASGDTIFLASGTYAGPGNRDLDPGGKKFTLRSQSGDADSCVIDCEGSAAHPHRGLRCQTSEHPWTRIEHLTIRNGYAENGAAILCTNVSSPTITGCIFEQNQASESGGALMLSDYSSPNLTDCIFRFNTAGGHGGAIYCSDCGPLITRCTFDRNAAGAGGALSSFASPVALWPTLIGCTLYGNTPDAIECEDSWLTADRTIIAFGTPEPPVRCGSAGEISLTCCDIFGNAAGDWIGCIADQAGSEQNFSADPLFCDPEQGRFELSPASPCALAPDCGRVGAWPIGCE